MVKATVRSGSRVSRSNSALSDRPAPAVPARQPNQDVGPSVADFSLLQVLYGSGYS